MARPTRHTISSGMQAWDADVEENARLTFDIPFPIKQYADFASLPAASADNMDCLAVITDEHELCISTGSAWKRILRVA